MSEHTKEPWVVNMDSTCSGAWPEIGTYDPSDGFQDIGRMGTSHVFDHENYDPHEHAATYQEAPHLFKLTYDGEEMIAKARRIVACVNACAGISIENLENNVPVKDLAHRYNAVIKQRDDLLAALKDLRIRYETLFGLYAKHAYQESNPQPDLDLALATSSEAIAAVENQP